MRNRNASLFSMEEDITIKLQAQHEPWRWHLSYSNYFRAIYFIFGLMGFLGEKTINFTTHRYVYTIFNIRPPGEADDPFDTDTNYCHYHEPHKDYLYNQDWIDFIIHLFQSGVFDMENLKKSYDRKDSLNAEDYEP